MKKPAALCALALLLCVPVFAGTQVLVKQHSLAQLCDAAEKIFRGTVIAKESGTVFAGGGVLPTVTYRVKVTESLKGGVTFTKGDESYIEVTMLGRAKEVARTDGFTKLSTLPELPELRIGQEYLLMTSHPSSVGLAATIGLGQGCFQITGKNEVTVNLANNFGLSENINGPVAYSVLRDEILGSLGQ